MEFRRVEYYSFLEFPNFGVNEYYSFLETTNFERAGSFAFQIVKFRTVQYYSVLYRIFE